jgi:predicted enzyme related to lactoylglutathione lyase
MGAKLIMVGMPFDDPAGAQEFYAAVLEYDFARSLSDEDSYHAIASEDGVDFLVSERHHAGEAPMPHFAVEDLDDAITRATDRGAQILWRGELTMPADAVGLYRRIHDRENGPGTVTNSVGRAVILLDPHGGLFGLVDPAEHTSDHFRTGRFARQLDAKQLRTHREAIRQGRNWMQRRP